MVPGWDSKIFCSMMRNFRLLLITGIVFVSGICITSCEKFFLPEQGLAVTEERLFKDWYEFRAAEMGLYAIQQQLVEQIIVLGELRGDLLTVTQNADADMVEIHDFNVSEGNKYASPTKFFELIGACNNLAGILQKSHPEVVDPESAVTNYDRLYGEVLCMRAWAYFMAVRIYGKVPYIYESLQTVEEILAYVESPGTYIDSVYIDFAKDGFYNDTTYNHTIELEKKYLDLEIVLDAFINELVYEVKAVGVNHYVENNDATWEITIWNTYAYHALLGHMYLTQGDLASAEANFRKIMINSTDAFRYQIDNTFLSSNWKSIFPDINNVEHIFTLPFSKGERQQHSLQDMFETESPHLYQLKPSQVAIDMWETVWRGQNINFVDGAPQNTRVINPGKPGDQYRGPGASYTYYNGSQFLEASMVMQALQKRALEDYRAYDNIMQGYYPVVWKYSLSKDIYDEDADFIVYRAAGIHLWMAEVYTYWAFSEGGPPRTYTQYAVNILNDGSNYSTDPGRPQRGVRGRVQLGRGDDRIRVSNIEYYFDPYTNEITGYRDLFNNLSAKQLVLEEKILDERARELAFEGERFFDLVRVAKRRDDPAFLAKTVSAKFPQERREAMYNLLLDEENWYIRYFD